MGNGYTRNDTANNIADGNVINASDLDGEFDAIQSAFNATTGHSHDGTTGEGPQIGTGGIADNAVTLGTKTTGNYVAAAGVSGVGLSGSASAEGATFTVTSNATSANTASTIVARDASGNFSAGNVTVGNLITAGNVDGRDVSADGSKLDGIEAGATADQTAAEIRTLVESATDSNVFTDADHSKLDGIEAGATADQTASEILTLIKTVDGAGSGLDADTLDGVSSASFLRSDAADTKTSGDLSFADNVKATFGAGSDLQIYHNGTSSFIEDTGSGDLFIRGAANVQIEGSTAGENMIYATENGAVRLYYDAAEKLATTATGVDVTGVIEFGDSHTIGDDGNDNLAINSSAGENIVLGPAGGLVNLADNKKLTFGTSSDLEIYHDGTDSVIKDRGTGNLVLTSNGGGIFFRNDAETETFANFNNNGSVQLRYDNATKFETTSGGIDVTGTVTMDGATTSGNINFGDNDKAIFGAGSDLQIYHSGTNSFIDDSGTGNLYLRSNDVRLQKYTGENMITATADAAVTLYYNNAAKLATKSTGVDITGNINAVDNIYLASTIYHEGDTNTYMQFQNADQWRVVTGGTEMLEINNSYVLLGANTAGKVETASKTGSVTPNLYVYNSFVWTLTGNITLNNPSTEITGMSGVFVFIHSGAGRTVSLGTQYRTVGGAGLTLSGAAGAVDLVPYFVRAGGIINLGTPQLGFAQ